MPSDKEKILIVIRNQPNDASYDDIIKALYINHKINIGIDQLKNDNSLGWLSLAEQTLQKLWNNKNDNENYNFL